MSNTDTTLSNRVSQLDELHLLAIVDCRISGINCCRRKKIGRLPVIETIAVSSHC